MAFMRLTGVGASSLSTARSAALSGHQSSLSRRELDYSRGITAFSKPPKYLDARQWLENYAMTHGEQSPMRLQVVLPSGRKRRVF